MEKHLLEGRAWKRSQTDRHIDTVYTESKGSTETQVMNLVTKGASMIQTDKDKRVSHQ